MSVGLVNNGNGQDRSLAGRAETPKISHRDASGRGRGRLEMRAGRWCSYGYGSNTSEGGLGAVLLLARASRWEAESSEGDVELGIESWRNWRRVGGRYQQSIIVPAQCAIHCPCPQ